MRTGFFNLKNFSVLDAAILAGLAAVFLAIAVPLLHGAILRRQTAECAGKIIRAADAFDFYAAAFGGYPESQTSSQETETRMSGAFARYHIDWWDAVTELGGHWNWYSNGQTSAVVISGPKISRQQMILLDKLLDDGNLETGMFQQYGSQYHYIIKEAIL